MDHQATTEDSIKMPFEALIAVVKDINRNPDELIIEALRSAHIEELVIEVNQNQLDAGIDANGNPIDPLYTETTIRYKISKGQEFRWVTLKDTGKFQKSFKVIYRNDEIEIVATDSKRKKLRDKYGAAILGLTQESIESLKAPLLEAVKEVILKRLEKR